MRRMVLAVAACVCSGLVAIAQDEKPKVAQPAQPFPRPVQVTAAKMAQLEEEVETLDAQREVKKAHIKAAEVGVRRAEIHFNRASQLAALNAVNKEDAENAKLDVEVAKAQVEIRVAELKEIEVKVKFARKRLEDAKAAGVRPVPNPRGVDPQLVRFADDEKEAAELKAKIEKTKAAVEKAAAEVKKAESQVQVAKDELAKIRDIAMRGRVVAGTIEKAEAKVTEAKDTLEKATKERKTHEDEAAALAKKLKEIEK